MISAEVQQQLKQEDCRNTEREILVTVVALRELGKLTSIIKQIDPHAFVTVNNVFEVLGEGFRRRF